MDLYDLGRKHYIVNLTGKIVIWTGGRSEPVRLRTSDRIEYTGNIRAPSYYNKDFEFSNAEKVPISNDRVNRCCDKGYVCRAYLYTLLFAILPSLSLIIFGAINMGAITL